MQWQSALDAAYVCAYMHEVCMATSNCFVRLVALPVIQVMWPCNVCVSTVTYALW